MTARAKRGHRIERVDMEELEVIPEEAKAVPSEQKHRKPEAAMETLTYLTSEIPTGRRSGA